MPILDDLHEIASLTSAEAVGTEIVQNEQIDLCQSAEETSEATVAVRELELCEETWHARVIGAVTLAAGPLSQGAGEPGLAQSAFAGNEKIAFLGNPAASRELLEERFVELALRAVVDVLDRGLAVAQARRTQADLRALGRAIGDLAIDQECEPFGMGEIPGGILLFELEEGVGHAVELQRSELVESGMGEHRYVSSMIEVGTADVVVNDRRPVRGFLGPFAIELGFEDGLDGAEGSGADGKCSLAGRLHPLARKASHEVHDAAAGAEALRGVSLLAQDDFDECGGVTPRPCSRCSGPTAPGAPACMAPSSSASRSPRDSRCPRGTASTARTDTPCHEAF